MRAITGFPTPRRIFFFKRSLANECISHALILIQAAVKKCLLCGCKDYFYKTLRFTLDLLLPKITDWSGTPTITGLLCYLCNQYKKLQKDFTANFLCTHTAAGDNKKVLHWLFQPGMLCGNVRYSNYLHSIKCFLLLVKIKTLAKLWVLVQLLISGLWLIGHDRKRLALKQDWTTVLCLQLFCTSGPYFLGSGESYYKCIHVTLLSQILVCFFPGVLRRCCLLFYTFFKLRLALLFLHITCRTAGTCPGNLWESISGRGKKGQF